MIHIQKLFLLLLSFTIIGCTTHSSSIGQNYSKVDRIALVIGNSEYKLVSELKNPVNDASDMADRLEDLNFNVIYKKNLNLNKMKQAIRNFLSKLSNSKKVGLFYYAGHAIQLDGKNYLIPIDAKISNLSSLESEAFYIGELLDKLYSNNLNIIILDACRNNPFSTLSKKNIIARQSRGIVELDRGVKLAPKGLSGMKAPSGTYISYSTAPGKVASDGEGKNGLYTQYLLRYMMKPGLTLEEVFKRVRNRVRDESNNQQIPWDQSSIFNDFYFIEAGGKRIITGTF